MKNVRKFCLFRKKQALENTAQTPCSALDETPQKTLRARMAALYHSPRTLVFGCYTLAILLFVAGGAISAVWDAVCYQTGRFTTQTITLADSELYVLNDFTLVGDDVLYAQTGDPSILLMPGQQVRRITVILADDSTSAERDLYYHLPGLGYSPFLRVWPTISADTTAYTYELPLITGQNIRLDLCDRSGASVRVVAFIINEPLPLWAYVTPSAWDCFWLCVLPAIAACVLLLCGDAYAIFAKSKKQ